MLYSPDAHEPIVEGSWDEPRVRDALRAIAADADSALDPVLLWPAHDWDVWQAEAPLTDLYVGAAGVLWALDSLRRRGYIDVRSDLDAASRRALERHRERPDWSGWDAVPSRPRSSLLVGEAGPLLVAWRVEPEDELADELHGLVLENVGNEANEWMWGPPGSLLAAHAMHGWTGEERWAAARQACADGLLSGWDEDGLWEVTLYGETVRPLSAPHGFAGNVLSLLQDSQRVDEIRRRARATAAREAIVEDGRATWPGRAGGPLVPADGELRLQWCHGGPGMIAGLADVLDDELLLAAAELTWQAGPLRKGPMLCHGTAGNGYALLTTFARTGDERWLERARRFALHALAQADALPPRYSLFTGTIGAALFAASCIEARAEMPAFPSFD